METIDATDAPAEVLPWDSEFWGLTVARVCSSRLDPETLAAVDAFASENDVACLYFLGDSGDAASAHAAEQGGFRLMDTRVELDRLPEASPQSPAVRPATHDDLPTLRSIARVSHGDTRFYADPRFPNERCDDLYDVWITRSVDGWADAVLVHEEGGYVTCHRADDSASIGLIAVDEHSRGHGVGEALVRGAVDWAAAQDVARATVVTQGRNIGAQRLFQRCGYRTRSIDLWFHKWYRP